MTEVLERVREFNNERLCWAVRGKHGGVHMWCVSSFSCGGVEAHGRQPLYESQREPSDAACWLIGCPCYHDGSSLWWEETGADIVGYSMMNRDDFRIWQELERWYCKKFDVDRVSSEWPAKTEVAEKAISA